MYSFNSGKTYAEREYAHAIVQIICQNVFAHFGLTVTHLVGLVVNIL